ncbi:MAG: hypothetical protein Tsb0021_06420 [Chlamydiales bacterium]
MSTERTGQNPNSNVNQVQETVSHARCPALEPSIYHLVIDGITRVHQKSQDEIDQIKQRQQRMRFLNQLLQELNNCKNDDFSMDINKSEQLKELIERAKAMGEEGEQLEAKAKRLEEEAEKLLQKAENLEGISLEGTEDIIKEFKKEAAAKKKEAQRLQDDAAELKDVSRSVTLLVNAKNGKLSKEERASVIENVRETLQSFNMIHNTQTSQVVRLQEDYHQRVNMGRSLTNELHNLKKSIIQKSSR